MIIMNLKCLILYFCIKFQEGVVVVCKIITLIPLFFMVCVLYCLRCWKWLYQREFISSIEGTMITEHSMWVLQLEDERKLAMRTSEALLKSCNQFIKKSEKFQPENLIRLIDMKSTVGFQGVLSFDNNDRQNCWTLPVVTLTAIAVTLPNIEKGEVDALYKSVREGLEYVTLVEKDLGFTNDDHLMIQQAGERLWQEVDVFHKWLGIRLKDISSHVNSHASQVDRTTHIV
ncbi:hypothetical protein HanRHA438_Chr12g0535011 [Helianthus annuus]|nr:hypothetical protein HanHA300_Chr12g0429141 [Helianthus annuus]KAJ0491446.1 hypothetical protein HanIR_Chr12g0563891 [Helianthus annuus]KAJ0673586.1 hypothetical protein HanLR1_Chr12g0430771 [Helianthus annuus]KAJ0676942.1 hypothetical protein HanOQP8_Chr12g0431521 [Helianthus annuus]KAJ0864919.1 hypothetical protein HanRHA438_Chr12g0535011 [Helianthus annuus]